MQKAKHRGEMSILYLFDSSDAKLKKFEDTLFKNEQVGIGMKLFNRIQVDVSKDSVAKEMAGNKLPQFIVFNAKGQRTADVTLKGYKASPSGLLRAMAKGAKGHSKLSFNAFVKKYRSLLNDIDKLEKQKEVHADKMTRAGDSKSKMKKLQKKADEMAKTQKDLTEREGEMLRGAGAVGHTKAPAPVAKK